MKAALRLRLLWQTWIYRYLCYWALHNNFNDYQIVGFPTYYVIDEAGNLASKSMGYSTELGMRVRTW